VCSSDLLGGKGLYLGAIDGKAMGHCVVIGGGILGFNAAESFVSIGANVTIIESNPEKRKALQQQLPTATVLPPDQLNSVIMNADIIIGAALIPGGKAPILISKQQIDGLKPGTVIIDLSIDQGGITEVSRPTSIKNPTFIYNKIIFCCVPNIPGTLPQTSTHLLTTATLSYVIALANQGLELLHSNHSFQTALNLYQGACTNKAVAEAVGVPYRPFMSVSNK
jgi:alanine dehydrogenase